MAEIDLLQIVGGSVVAPAGCGKTQLITEAVGNHGQKLPVLVLTHTNAGVAALRGRLEREKVPSKKYRLSTIDGWAMRLASMFPARAELDGKTLELKNPGTDYPKIRDAAVRLLKKGHINDILSANYSHLIVDEYQDCSIRQHAIVLFASAAIPTCVLGDPLQAIFGFGSDKLADWDRHVCAAFPIKGELDKPWRWINADANDLGAWLLEVRRRLRDGESIDLRAAPKSVAWVRLDGERDHELRLAAANTKPVTSDGSVLIVGDSTSPVGQRRIASQVPGAVTVEAVDLKDLVEFARRWDLDSPAALDELLAFAENVMTAVGRAEILDRVKTILAGRARKPPSAAEGAALAFQNDPNYETALTTLVEINKQAGVRVFRPAVLRACTRALQMSERGREGSFLEAVLKMREEYRFLGRTLGRRTVGSTLLLKGLESDTVVILNAEELTPANLYVAMTRGARALVICSQSPVLNS